MNASQVLAHIPEISYRQLDTWCSRGFLRPDQRGGSDYARTFSGDEVLVARTMARLVAAGITPTAAHRVARGQPHLAPGVWIVVDRMIPADLLDSTLSQVAS